MYKVPPSASSNRCRAVIRNGHVGATLRNSPTVGGSHTTTSLVARIGTHPSRPRMLKRVPTPIGRESARHSRTAGSINGAVSGDMTTANTSDGGLISVVVCSIVVVRRGTGAPASATASVSASRRPDADPPGCRRCRADGPLGPHR